MTVFYGEENNFDKKIWIFDVLKIGSVQYGSKTHLHEFWYFSLISVIKLTCFDDALAPNILDMLQ